MTSATTVSVAPGTTVQPWPVVDVVYSHPDRMDSAHKWLNDEPVVLVVDDDDDVRETIAVMLEREGLATIQAGTAREALERIVREHVAAVLLDVVLPDWSGLDVCRILRDDAIRRDLPIILVTALTDVENEVSGILAGADGYVAKPVVRRELLRRLREVI